MARHWIISAARFVSFAISVTFLIGLVAQVATTGAVMLPARPAPEPAHTTETAILLAWAVSSIIAALPVEPA